MLEIKRILAPIDFADCSQRGLELALRVAESFGAKVEILHVWMLPDFVSPTVAITLGAGKSEELERIAREQIDAKLSDFLAGIPRPDRVPVEVQITYGIAEEVILERARGCDLVVMGTHGRRGMAHMFLGSVTEKVIRACKCPVLITGAQG